MAEDGDGLVGIAPGDAAQGVVDPLSRLAQAQRQGVPMTNYGVAIAYLTGILEQVSW